MAISFRAKTHSVSAATTEPAGTAQGDDVFLWIVSASTGSPVAPAGGWTLLGSWIGTNSKFFLWWVKRGSAAPGYTWTGNSGFAESSALAYQGRVSSSTPLVVVNAAHQINPQNPDCPAAASAPAGAMVIALGGSWTGSVGAVWGPPAGYTIREDGGGSIGNDIMVAEKLLVAGGVENPGAFSNGSATLDDVAEATVTLFDATGGFALPLIRPSLPGSPWYLKWITRAQPLSGPTTAVLNNYVLPADTGVFTYAGSAASMLATRLLAAVTGVYALTGIAALLAFGHKLFANTGVYALTGSAASVLATRLLAATKGTFTLTGNAAATLWKHLLVAGTGVFTLTGSAASIARTYVLGAATGVYSLIGQVASVVYSGGVATAISEWVRRRRGRN